MNCDAYRHQIDDALDGRLDAFTSVARIAHAAQCADCSYEQSQRAQLVDALRALPRPAMPAHLPDQLFARLRTHIAAHERVAQIRPVPLPQPQVQRPLLIIRRRRLRLVAISVAASAAVVAMTLTTTTLTERAPTPASHVLLANQALDPVRVVFHSPRDLESVTIELELPAGMQLAGADAGIQSLRWQTNLRAGANLLELPLTSTLPADGQMLLARLSYGGEQRQFQVRVRHDRAIPSSQPATSDRAPSAVVEVRHV